MYQRGDEPRRRRGRDEKRSMDNAGPFRANRSFKPQEPEHSPEVKERITLLANIMITGDEFNKLIKSHSGRVQQLINSLRARPKLSMRPSTEELVSLLEWQEQRLELITGGLN